ncbi:DUF1674 domain-containing protein [Devosia sp.]|uniref:DUF1674 domain-containing protein n=1 Tax=Devosia sp. TaxID=1871048 RepID=UPI003BAAACC8
MTEIAETETQTIPERELSPAAQRALDEAAQRRRELEDLVATGEKGGRGGLDPVRYGDWEIKGLTADF